MVLWLTKDSPSLKSPRWEETAIKIFSQDFCSGQTGLSFHPKRSRSPLEQRLRRPRRHCPCNPHSRKDWSRTYPGEHGAISGKSPGFFGFPADSGRCRAIGIASCDRNFMKLRQFVQLPIGLPTVILWMPEGILLHSSQQDPHRYVRTRGLQFF